MDDSGPPAGGRILAYAISALTTLLWVGCVLPSGTLAVAVPQDMATPMHREAPLLIPALLLLIVGPAGFVLSRTRVGLLAVLSATDAFIALYAAFVLSRWGALLGSTSVYLVGLLYGFGILSVFETVRVLRFGPEGEVSSRWRGLRLAICLLVLLTPSILLVQDGRELASLLAPYALLAVSTGGAVLARSSTGLRLTAALLHLALALHLVVTLRYTIFEADAPRRPAIHDVNVLGYSTLGLAVVVLALTLAQAIRLARRVRAEHLAPAGAKAAS